MSLLTPADVALLTHALRDAGTAHRPLSYYLTLLTERRTRALVPLVAEQQLRGARRLLRAPPYADTDPRGSAAVVATALHALGARQVHIELCSVAPGAEHQTPATPFSAGDTAIHPGCDVGAGRDYEAKTDLHTLWIAATLLTRQRRTTAVRVAAAGGAEVDSFTLYTLLHEYSHILATQRPAAFAPLARLYDEAASALRAASVTEAAIGASVADRIEFVADAFGAENARRALVVGAASD